MLAIGPENFRAMLDGFHEMDEDFPATAPFERNLPALMGLLSSWYDHFLRRADRRRFTLISNISNVFPPDLQQLRTMEKQWRSM